MKYIVKTKSTSIECDTRIEMLQEIEQLRDFGFTIDEITVIEQKEKKE